MEKNLKIVYEDDWLIVVDKPCGMLSMSTGKAGEVTAYSMLTDYMREKQGRKGGSVKGRMQGRVFIVHRLDRDTSGLLVLAKDEDTKLALQENWSEAVISRKYEAVLEGKIEDEEGWIETWLYENPKSMMVHCYEIGRNENPGKPPRKGWTYASSHCRTTGQQTIDNQTYTKVEFELETGRRNQIRVHSQWIGHPIAGDRKYGAKTNPFGRLALHAKTLEFIHPWTGKTLRFTSPLPRNLKQHDSCGKH